MRRAHKQNQQLKSVPNKRTVNLACRLIATDAASAHWSIALRPAAEEAGGGHRYQIPGRWAHCALQPRPRRVRNYHHPSGDPDRAIFRSIRCYRAADTTARRERRPAARQAALTNSLYRCARSSSARSPSYSAIATESGTLRPPMPVAPSASDPVRAPKHAGR